MIYINGKSVFDDTVEDPTISKDIVEPSSVTDEGSMDDLPLC